MAYTIKDVALRAGVSYQTVSRAVNHPDDVSAAVLARVRDAMVALSWEPDPAARALRRRGWSSGTSNHDPAG